MHDARSLILSILMVFLPCSLDVTASELRALTTKFEESNQRGSIKELGDYAQALEDAVISSDDVHEKIEALQLISDIEVTRGKKGRAIRSLGEAVALSGATGNLHQHARSLRIISGKYKSLGAQAKARDVLYRAIRILETNNQSVPDLMDWYKDLGMLEGELGNPTKAEKNFRKLLQLPECLDEFDRAQTLLNVINALLRQEDSTAGLLSALNEFHELFAVLRDDTQKGILAVELGASIARLSRQNQVLQDSASVYLRHGLRIAIDQGDIRYQSYATGYLGKLAFRERNYKEALRLTREALVMASNEEHREIEYLWQWQIAQIHRSMDDPMKALASYRSAVQSIENIRSQLLAGRRIDFRELVLPVFQELTDLLLKQASLSVIDSDRQSLLYEARETMELFNTSEVLDYFDGDCVLPSNQLTLESIGERNVVIYPLALHDRLSVLAKFPDGIFQYVTDIDRASLNEVIEDFRYALEVGDDEYLEHAATLHTWLIAPLEKKLKQFNVENLVFVPTGLLRTIPLSALFDGEKYLIEKYAVTTSLGLQLTDPRPLGESGYKLLLGGISEKVGDFESLPGVVEEIEQIHESFSGDVLLNSQFTVDALSTHLGIGDYSVVHLATHGYFDQEPSLSFLLTYNGKFTLEHLQETVGLRRFVDEPLELLVLSACETARGNERAALGLAGVSLKSGARSTLASLWKISDEATTKIMIEFYTHLKAGASKSESLRRSQLAFIKDSKYSHPHLWSPYLLIGNWL